MAAKKKAGKFGEKSAFVRAQPGTMSAAEIVDAAKKKGISLSANYVYLLRSKAGSKRKGKPGPKPGRGKRGAGRAGAAGSAETQLRSAIAAIGLTAARRVLDEVERTFSGR